MIATCDHSDVCRIEPLRRTLLALNDQTITGAFEVLVIDDGSPVDTRSLVDQLPLQYPYRWFWQPHAGFRAARARNTRRFVRAR